MLEFLFLKDLGRERVKRLKFKKIDAFSTGLSSGNPLGFIEVDTLRELRDDQMLQCAREMKGFVNEVGYLERVEADRFKLKYYSSEREVDFCGHATIGILYELFSCDDSLKELSSVVIETNRGVLSVENALDKEDAVYIEAPEPEFKEFSSSLESVARALEVDITEISTQYPIRVINGGLNTLIVPFNKLDILLNIKPDLEKLKKFCFNLGVDIIEVFTTEVADKGSDYRTRVFAPTFGYLEDPATGSGNSAFGYYLVDLGLYRGGGLAIEQNSSYKEFNIVKLKLKDNRIHFGGKGITRIHGEYLLQ